MNERERHSVHARRTKAGRWDSLTTVLSSRPVVVCLAVGKERDFSYSRWPAAAEGGMATVQYTEGGGHPAVAIEDGMTVSRYLWQGRPGIRGLQEICGTYKRFSLDAAAVLSCKRILPRATYACR